MGVVARVDPSTGFDSADDASLSKTRSDRARHHQQNFEKGELFGGHDQQGHSEFERAVAWI